MKKRFGSLLLAIILVCCFAFPVTAGATTGDGNTTGLQLESGGIAMNGTGLTYAANSSRIRTQQGYAYKLSAGSSIGLDNYSDGAYILLFLTNDGETFTMKSVRSGSYTATSDIYAAFVIVFKTKQTDLSGAARLNFQPEGDAVPFENIVPIVPYEPDYEVESGGIAMDGTGIKYAANTSRIRTVEGKAYKLSKGNSIGLDSYADGAYILLFLTYDGETFTMKSVRSGSYVATEDVYAAFVIVFKTKQNDLTGSSRLVFVPDGDAVPFAEIAPFVPQYEVESGGIAMNGTGLSYAANTSRIRTVEGKAYKLSAGNSIGLDNYADGAYILLFLTNDGETFTMKSVRSGSYTAASDIYAAFVIVFKTKQNDLSGSSRLVFEAEGDAVAFEDIVPPINYQLESGGIAMDGTGIKYAANSKRIRTEEGYVYKLSEGSSIGLNDYSDGAYILLFLTNDGENYTMKSVRSGSYVATADIYAAFVIIFPTAQTDLSGAYRLAFEPEDDAVLASSLTEIREYTYTLTVDSDFCAIQYTVTYDTDVYQFVSAEYPMFLDASGEDYIGSFTYHDASDADQPMIGVIKANCAKAVDDLCCEDGEQIIKLRVKCLADAPVVVPQMTIVRLADINIMQGDVGQNLDYTWSYTFTNVATGDVLDSANG